MAQNTQEEKDQNSEQVVEKHIEEMLGPPPVSSKRPEPKPVEVPEVPVVPEVGPPPEPVLPIDNIEPDPIQEVPEERVLVIPPSDEQAVPSVETEPDTPPPTAGETITPTNPSPEDQEFLGAIAASKDQAAIKKDGNIKQFFKSWWHNRLARRSTIAVILVLIAAVVIYPSSRYFILNNAGVRSSASLTILDNSTQLPLKDVEVSLAGQTAKTDENGNARIEHIKLGKSQLIIQKRAFATIKQSIVLGWGSNPLGSFQVKPTGSQYAIFIKDWLTGKPVTEANASSGDADAQADQKGKILLTIDTATAQQDTISVTIHADNYRDEKLELDLSSKADRTVRMVTNRKDVFISNQSGKYDVYSVSIDGKDKKLVLAGTGLERDDISIVQHPTESEAALVSSRVNARNSDGYLLSTLTLINLEDNSTQAISQSEQVQIVGWIGRRLIYVEIAAGASAADPQRFRLISYDYKTTNKKQLDSANSFNDILLVGDQIYYAPSSAYQKDPNTGLKQSNADGSKTTTLIKDDVWNIFRVSYDTLNIATEKDWYEYKIGGNDDPVKLTDSPANPNNRLYIPNQKGNHNLWVDQRDGKGLLIDFGTDKKTDTTLATQKGLNYPVQWLTDDILIYRIRSEQETADYVLSITGGKPHKVTDLYNATGVDRWYYY